MPEYADVSDLLLGDLTLGPSVSPNKYLREATEDVDIAIGQVYQMPYDIQEVDAVPRTVILLRRITARLASGRLILAQAVGGEDVNLQAYGQSLVDEAKSVINAIVEGRLEFEGPELVPGAAEVTAPTIHNHDADSAVDAFYQTFMGNNMPVPLTGSPIWRPGG